MMEFSLSQSAKDVAIQNMIDNLPVLRAMCHFSQYDLAELIGLSRQTIVMIENRKRSMSWSVFLSLMFVFTQNEETERLLKPLNIYTDELMKIYKM